MDQRDQTTITSGGQESHGVHVCANVDGPFPNLHPSSRYRRAHKKICGTIEGYKLVDSGESTHLTILDEECLSDDDLKTPREQTVATHPRPFVFFSAPKFLLLQRYEAITNAYYCGATGALIVYDVTQHVTFESADKWLKQLRNHAGANVVMILVGNKIDLKKLVEVTTDEAKANAKEQSLHGTSALDATNVEEAFAEVLTQIYWNNASKKAIGGGDEVVLPLLGKGVKIDVSDGVTPNKKTKCY